MTDDATRPIETPTVPPAPAEPPMQAVEPTAAASTDTAATADAAVTADAGAPEAVAPVAAAQYGGQPVAAATATSPGRSRVRWTVAILVAGLAIAATIGAILLFGQQSTPVALQYIPGDAAVVAEMRLDLPGDQMQHLGNLLAHFPGFADQSTLGAKLDEALGKLVESSGEKDLSYQADVKPWLSGPTFLGVLSLNGSATEPTPADVVISATTSGAAACTSLFKDQTVTHETYGSLDIVISASGTMACVLDGRQAVLGSVANVRKALDAKAGGTGMDKSVNYKAARAALGGDRLATLYFDGTAVTKAMPTPSALPVPGLESLIGNVPAWFMGGVRSEDDAVVVDYVTASAPAPTAGPSLVAVPATHASVITSMLPGDTLAYVEAQGAGASLQNLLAQLRQIPEINTSLQALDGMGGAGELVGWVDDVGLAVSMHGEKPDASLLLVAKDEAAATARVASLKTLLQLAGANAGLQVADSTVNGVTVTTVTITDLGALVPPGSVPGVTDLPSGPVSFSIAARGRTLIVTFGDTAMSAILNTAAGASLADNAAFKHALTRGITNPRTTVYLGVGATLNLVKGFLSADELATFQKDAAPYVNPLEGFLLQATNDAAGSRSRMVITVSQP